jgi:hypothetical protein
VKPLQPPELTGHIRTDRVSLALLVGGLLAACGGGAPATGSIGGNGAPVSASQSLPTALQLWAAFPVHASPRPIILVGGSDTGPRGVYGNDETKLALICSDYQPPAQLPTGPPTAGGYRVTSAARAFALLGPQQHTGSCATPHTPVTLTEAHLGQATYGTDRGPRTLPAWLFSFAAVEGPIAVLAITPDAEWLPQGLVAGGSGRSYWAGAVVGRDHRTLTVGLVGAQSDNGPCGVRYAVKLTESPTAVMVTLITSANESTVTMNCTLMGFLRHASAVLKAPLGARVLVDDVGYPLGAMGSP